MADDRRQAQPVVELDDRRGTDQTGVHASLPSHTRRQSSTLRGFAGVEARHTIDARQWRTFKENELNPLTDLRLLDHVKDVDENLSCPICRCAFVDHVVLECNHAFCRDCLRQTWTEHSPFGPRGKCPTCRTPAKLPPRSNANRIIGNMLDELEVKCPKHEQGCTTILKRAQVDDHVKLYCSYGRVECSAPQCHEPVSRIDSAHDCMHFPVTCLDCHAMMMEADLHAHWSSECPDHRTVCKNCQEIVLYRELNNHNTQECPAVRVSCPGSMFGCTVSLKRDQMEDHLQACMLAKIAPFMLAQKQKIEEQEVAQLQLNRRIEVLESGFKHIESVLDEHDLLAEDSADLAYVPTDFSLMIQNEGTMPDLGSTFTPHPTLVPDSAPRRWPRNASISTDYVQDWPPNETSVANTHGWLASAQATADDTSAWPRDFLDIPSPLSRRQSSQRSRAAPFHHLMSMHETLREEVSRVSTALSDLDGRQSMQMLNDNLRMRDELAYLNGAVARVSRELMVLRAQQAPNTAVAVPREYGENAGAGAGVEAAVNAVANAASALRGVARMASSAGSSSGHEMGGRLTRRSTNDENRTKL